jgi:glyoxylase-like metal-dependent hydrolase (beta-lactamase superfamily II)
MVINSHPHNDHIWGNQVFSAEVDIISTNRTRELIATEGLAEVQEYRRLVPERLEAVQAEFAEAQDEATKNHLRIYVTYFQAINATLPELQVRLPNLTFTGELTFNGTKRSAKLIAYERGHSGSDTILHLPDDGIVFMSDLLFIGIHPYLPDGDPEKIHQIMADVRHLQPKTLVPGHGPIGQTEHLHWMDEYIDTLNGLVSEAIANGATEEQIDKLPIPAKYQNLIYPSFFPANLKFLFQRQIKSETGSGK